MSHKGIKKDTHRKEDTKSDKDHLCRWEYLSDKYERVDLRLIHVLKHTEPTTSPSGFEKA
jgi:hypothetical protein